MSNSKGVVLKKSKGTQSLISFDSSILTNSIADSNTKNPRLPPITAKKKHNIGEGNKKTISYTRSPLALRSAKIKSTKKTSAQRKRSDGKKAAKIDGEKRSTAKEEKVTELMVEPMSLHRISTIASLKSRSSMVSIGQQSIGPNQSISFDISRASLIKPKATTPQVSKKKTKPVAKLSAQSIYTNKAIQSYQSATRKEDQTSLIQYRPDIIRPNMRTIREQWSTRRNSTRKHHHASEMSFMDIRAPTVISFRKSGYRHKKAQMKMRKISIRAPKERSVSTASIATLVSVDQEPQPESSKMEMRDSHMSTKKTAASLRSISKRFSKFLRRKRTNETRLQFVKRILEQFQRFQVAGVRAMKLSDSTQDILGIKEKLNLENPWFCLDIDELLDKIKLVKTYSEALKMLEVIVPYPDPEILMGYFPYPSMFLVCTTREAKNQIITMLEDDLINALNTIENKICRTPFRWLSFGSEKEIDEPSRTPLCQVNISIVCPLLYPEINKFKMRTVQQARDGYVEVLSLRKTYNNIYRCKLDASTQTNTFNISIGTEIGHKIWKNRGTQYSYPYKNIELSKQQNQQLMLFLEQQYNNIRQTLTENSFMFIHSNDYQLLRHKNLTKPKASKQITQFWEPKYCKNKNVAQVVWNPWVSGTIAVVYSETNTIVSNENFERINVQEENYVLIWNYDNDHTPEQLLFSEKVITTISFCPQDSGIIIGGCLTGDILVWLLPDYNEILQRPQEFLTEKMYNHRNLMMSMCSWIKNVYERDIIKVMAFSSTRFCHLGEVTRIKWLLPRYKFTANGELMNVRDDSARFLQFLSCGIDGSVFIWDVPKMIYTQTSILSTRRRTHTAQRYANILKEKTLIPRYTMKISLNNMPNCVTSIQIPNQKVKFETLKRTPNKTMFHSMDDPTNEPNCNGFYLATYLGTVASATWGKYGHILKETSDNLKVSKILHDGPITAFEIHPIVSNLVLSVGGKIFAIWYMTKMDTPVFWRRRSMDLVSGFWSLANAKELMVATFDGILETWNFMESGKYPLSTVHITKYPIAGLFNDVATQHAQRNTLILTDYTGLVKVLTKPYEESETVTLDISREELIAKVENIFKQRNIFKGMLCPKKSNVKTVIEETEGAENTSSRKNSVHFKKSLTEVTKSKSLMKEWKKAQQKKMEMQKEKRLQQNIELLKEKFFQSTDQENFKENLPYLMEMNLEYRRKMLDERIKTRHTVIHRKVDNILLLVNTNIPSKLMKVPLQKDNCIGIKRRYIDEYRNMEDSILKYIEWNQYNMKLNWMDHMDKRWYKQKKKRHICSAVTFIDSIVQKSSCSVVHLNK